LQVVGCVFCGGEEGRGRRASEQRAAAVVASFRRWFGLSAENGRK